MTNKICIFFALTALVACSKTPEKKYDAIKNLLNESNNCELVSTGDMGDTIHRCKTNENVALIAGDIKNTTVLSASTDQVVSAEAVVFINTVGNCYRVFAGLIENQPYAVEVCPGDEIVGTPEEREARIKQFESEQTEQNADNKIVEADTPQQKTNNTVKK